MGFSVYKFGSGGLILKSVAILLAAGSGKRMNADVKKQYIELAGKPVIYYALKEFEESFIDEVIMVVSPGDEEYCKKEIVDYYGFNKVKKIVPGGKERYDSVWNGIKAIEECDYVFIHDGARAFVTSDILMRCMDDVISHKACVAAVKAKDTIKLSDDSGFVKETLNRNYLYTIQTPQVFDYSLVKDAYSKLMDSVDELLNKGISITDDTMVVETFSDVKVKLTEGSYENIKITTPEDLLLGSMILEKRK